MVEENITREFVLKNIDETKIYSLKEINQNNLIDKKNKKACLALNFCRRVKICGITTQIKKYK